MMISFAKNVSLPSTPNPFAMTSEPFAISVADEAKLVVVDHFGNGGSDRSSRNAEVRRQRVMRWIGQPGVTVEISGERDGHPRSHRRLRGIAGYLAQPKELCAGKIALVGSIAHTRLQ